MRVTGVLASAPPDFAPLLGLLREVAERVGALTPGGVLSLRSPRRRSCSLRFVSYHWARVCSRIACGLVALVGSSISLPRETQRRGAWWVVGGWGGWGRGPYARASLCGCLVASRPPGDLKNTTSTHPIARGRPPVSFVLHGPAVSPSLFLSWKANPLNKHSKQTPPMVWKGRRRGKKGGGEREEEGRGERSIFFVAKWMENPGSDYAKRIYGS